MQILDDEEERLFRGEREEKRDDGLECLLFLALRCQIQGRNRVGNRQGQEPGPQRERFGRGQVVPRQARF